MSDENYEPCPSCAPRRAAGEFLSALGCHGCKGKGFRRKPSTYICNGCGGPMCPAGTHNEDSPHGLVEASVTGGYDSHHIFDTTTYTFSVCEQCLREMFGRFKVKPDVSSCVGHGLESYEQDEAAYHVRIWRDKDGHIAKLATGICNATEQCPAPATMRHFVSGHMCDESYCEMHASFHTYGNSRWINAALCFSIPLKVEDRTELDKQRLIEAYLSFTSVNKPTWFRYVSDCIRDVVNCPEETGAFWLPEALPAPEWLMKALGERVVMGLVLTTGRLFYGQEHQLRALASRHAEDVIAGM